MSTTTIYGAEPARWNERGEGRAERREAANRRKPVGTTSDGLRARLAASEAPQIGVLAYEDDGVPILAAMRRVGRTCDGLVIVCPYCGREHIHGAGGGDGLRESHCRGGGGYILREVT